MKERATFVQDILSDGAYLFQKPIEYDPKTIRKKWKDHAKDLMEEWNAVLKSIDTFDPSSIEASFKDFIEKKGVGLGAALPLFRLLVTGKGMGPSMFEIASFLGQDECAERILHGINSVQKLKKGE
jgi:glutamyl-tRNA synthetase